MCAHKDGKQTQTGLQSTGSDRCWQRNGQEKNTFILSLLHLAFMAKKKTPSCGLSISLHIAVQSQTLVAACSPPPPPFKMPSENGAGKTQEHRCDVSVISCRHVFVYAFFIYICVGVGGVLYIIYVYIHNNTLSYNKETRCFIVHV